MLVSGDPGIGKTSLLAAAEAAGARGFSVLSVRADTLEAELSFGVCAQLFGEVSRRPAAKLRTCSPARPQRAADPRRRGGDPAHDRRGPDPLPDPRALLALRQPRRPRSAAALRGRRPLGRIAVAAVPALPGAAPRRRPGPAARDHPAEPGHRDAATARGTRCRGRLHQPAAATASARRRSRAGRGSWARPSPSSSRRATGSAEATRSTSWSCCRSARRERHRADSGGTEAPRGPAPRGRRAIGAGAARRPRGRAEEARRGRRPSAAAGCRSATPPSSPRSSGARARRRRAGRRCDPRRGDPLALRAPARPGRRLRLGPGGRAGRAAPADRRAAEGRRAPPTRSPCTC